MYNIKNPDRLSFIRKISKERGIDEIFSIEDVGTTTPWQADLTVPALFVVGGERQGIPRTILDKSHTVLGLPMYGFIPSYNLQAAMAMVMGERLRQMEK